MLNRYHYRNVTWIDLESPTFEETKVVAAEYNLNQPLLLELQTPTLKPKVDLYHDYIYLVLHFPAVRHSHIKDRWNQEIDFVIGKNFIVTTHYDVVDPLHEFSKIFEVNSILHRSDMGDHGGYVFYHMLRYIYKSVGNELDGIKSRLSAIEKNIFSGRETEMVTEISRVDRDILDIKWALRPHQQVLDSLEVASVKLFGGEFDYPMKILKNEYFRAHDEILSCNELATEMRDTNDALVSTRQNEIMKTLTIMAFVTFPLSLIAAIFGMNTSFIPIIGMPGDFWVVISIMAVLTGIFFAYFRHRKWL